MKKNYVCEVSYESYILFFTVNVMLTATVKIWKREKRKLIKTRKNRDKLEIK